MGIDIYLHWEGMTEAEADARYTGFDATAGNLGYLREAYHGGPYVTRVLMPEAFYRPEWMRQIPYDQWDNLPDPPPDERDHDEHGPPIPAMVLRARLDAAREAFEERMAEVYPDDDDEIKAKFWKSFVDFVELAERKERETGYMCRVYASY